MNHQDITQKKEEPVPRTLTTASLLGRSLLAAKRKTKKRNTSWGSALCKTLASYWGLQ